MPETTAPVRGIPLKRQSPATVEGRYANSFVVQHTDDAFILSFFEIIPPLLVGSPEEQRAQIEGVESVPANCVARIIVSPKGMKMLVEIFQTNLDRFLSKPGEED